MAERFFLDSQLPGPTARRSGMLVTLAGLVGAVALFVSTLSMIASQHDARQAPAGDAPTNLPRAQVPTPGAS